MGQETGTFDLSVALRRAEPADAARLREWRTEPSAARYQPLRHPTVAELTDMLGRENAAPLDASFSGTARIIVETAIGPAGWITLREVNREHRTGDIGYTIGEAFRGRGIARAAVGALLPRAFQSAGLERLGAVAAVENSASRRVLEQSGFVLEGITRAYLIIAGQRVDHARYSLLKHEWMHQSPASR